MLSSTKCSEKERSIDVLDVLEEWIMVNRKPKKIMHDNGIYLHTRSSNALLSITTLKISRFQIPIHSGKEK
jgi:hypothetical protein